MRFSKDLVEEIRSRNDIVELIGMYVNLKRAGSNFSGLCPYHSERSPSFTVFPATQSFYCFGCGAGGDAITFAMRSENLDYPAAVEFLAKRAGITIQTDEHEERGISRARVFEMNLAAAKYFRNCLFDDKTGRAGMEYLSQKRRLPPAIIKRFGLGFAPDGFGGLTDHMKRLGFTEEELIVGFLCGKSQKTGRAYDYFRNRVIFPIINTSGDVIGFGGRVMDDSKPKYLNTSDTPAFKKSRHLFALNYAKKCCAEQMLLCEGYMDVIALHAAGFENAVATLGTAITSEQARIFAKYTKKVIICYDSDSAGQNATEKAMRLLGEVGVEVKVLQMAGAKDPDEYIKQYGVESFRRLLGESMSGFEHKLTKIVAARDINIPEEKIKAANEVSVLIAAVGSTVERDIYTRSAAERLGVSFDALRTDVKRAVGKLAREYKQKESSDAKLQIKNLGDRINIDAAKHIKANANEEVILGLMLMFDDMRRDAANGKTCLASDDFMTEFGRRVFDAVCELERTEAGFSKAMLGQLFTPDEMGRIEKLELDRRQLVKNDREVFESCIAGLKAEKNKANATANDPFGDLKAKQAAYKNKKNKEQ